jgi:hypothetical protein
MWSNFDKLMRCRQVVWWATLVDKAEIRVLRLLFCQRKITGDRNNQNILALGTCLAKSSRGPARRKLKLAKPACYVCPQPDDTHGGSPLIERPASATKPRSGAKPKPASSRTMPPHVVKFRQAYAMPASGLVGDTGRQGWQIRLKFAS